MTPAGARRTDGVRERTSRRGAAVRDPRALRHVSIALVVMALPIGVTAVITGASAPPSRSLVLFAVLAAFAVNRYTLFPSEMSVTAESAVLLAAVVVFRRDAPILGPWCVAALVGPLDSFHWEHRAFSRMAYNGAHQMLAVVAAAVVFDAVMGSGSAPVTRFLAAAVAASFAVLAVVLAAGLAAFVWWARFTPATALRHLLALDWVVVPLGLLGALAGQAALTRGIWVLPLVLVPASFLPELVLGRARWLRTGSPDTVRRRLVGVGAVAGVAVAAAPAYAVGGGDGLIVVLLVGVSVLVGVELRVGRSGHVAPLAAVALTLALGAGPLGWTTALVGAVATMLAAASACVAARVPGWRPLAVSGYAFVLAGAMATAVVLVRHGVGWSGSRHLGALGAGIGFAAVAAAGAPAAIRRREVERVAWSIPLVATMAALSLSIHRFGLDAAPFVAMGVVAVAAVTVVWAAPPWPSGVLVAWVARVRWHRRREALVALGVSSLVAAFAAVTLPSGAPRHACALTALVLAEVALALATLSLRQWRFNSHRRVRDGVMAMVVSVTVLSTALALGEGRPWSAVVIAGGVVTALATGLGAAGRADDAQRASLEPSR